MILDNGICTVFRGADIAGPGEMPNPVYTVIGKSWFGELSFASSPSRPTEGRQEKRIDNKIRILQNRAIRENTDVVILRDLDRFADRQPEDEVFLIVRAFHGLDDDSPTEITDLSLEVTRP